MSSSLTTAHAALAPQSNKRGLDAAIKHTKIHATGIPDQAAWLSMDTREGEKLLASTAIHRPAGQRRITKPSTRNSSKHSAAHPPQRLAMSTTSYGNMVPTILHGKGATPAWCSENGNPLLGLIPLNMAEPILLTIGSNNTDYLGFSPHGAGRNKSRRATLRRYTRSKKSGFDQKLLESDLAAVTAGLDVRWFQGRPDITETPLGYKPRRQSPPPDRFL